MTDIHCRKQVAKISVRVYVPLCRNTQSVVWQACYPEANGREGETTAITRQGHAIEAGLGSAKIRVDFYTG